MEKGRRPTRLTLSWHNEPMSKWKAAIWLQSRAQMLSREEFYRRTQAFQKVHALIKQGPIQGPHIRSYVDEMKANRKRFPNVPRIDVVIESGLAFY